VPFTGAAQLLVETVGSAEQSRRFDRATERGREAKIRERIAELRQLDAAARKNK